MPRLLLLLLLLTALAVSPSTSADDHTEQKNLFETAWRPHLFSLQRETSSSKNNNNNCKSSPQSGVLFQLLLPSNAERIIAAGKAASRCQLHEARLPTYREVYAMRAAVSADSLDDLFRANDTMLQFVATDLTGYALATAAQRFRLIQLSPLSDGALARVGVNCVICLRDVDSDGSDGGCDSTPATVDGSLDVGRTVYILICLLSVVSSVLVALIISLLCVNVCHLVCRRSAVALGNSELDELVDAEKIGERRRLECESGL
ncbi:hypothetical protein BOX15_Mlig009351g1 [Macrostomum lignano]|uniref:Cadherin domain-containing protein n=1 Tax=Macrostomum lignano TaxID=282301 RepID=A0A267GTY2_9PLAT|nr:hypothetical protein BOX15_Mlig009351g1 [Macrostomum lignano]